MTKNQKTGWTIVGTIAGVVVVSVLVQWARFYNAVKDLKVSNAIVLPKNYFPFNGAYSKDVNGKIVHQTATSVLAQR